MLSNAYGKVSQSIEWFVKVPKSNKNQNLHNLIPLFLSPPKVVKEVLALVGMAGKRYKYGKFFYSFQKSWKCRPLYDYEGLDRVLLFFYLSQRTSSGDRFL